MRRTHALLALLLTLVGAHNAQAQLTLVVDVTNETYQFIGSDTGLTNRPFGTQSLIWSLGTGTPTAGTSAGVFVIVGASPQGDTLNTNDERLVQLRLDVIAGTDPVTIQGANMPVSYANAQQSFKDAIESAEGLELAPQDGIDFRPVGVVVIGGSSNTYQGAFSSRIRTFPPSPSGIVVHLLVIQLENFFEQDDPETPPVPTDASVTLTSPSGNIGVTRPAGSTGVTQASAAYFNLQDLEADVSGEWMLRVEEPNGDVSAYDVSVDALFPFDEAPYILAPSFDDDVYSAPVPVSLGGGNATFPPADAPIFARFEELILGGGFRVIAEEFITADVGAWDPGLPTPPGAFRVAVLFQWFSGPEVTSPYTITQIRRTEGRTPALELGPVVMTYDSSDNNPFDVPVRPCPADFDQDGDVDLGDFGVFGAAFDSVFVDDNYNRFADFDNDGDVDLGDFGVFGAQFDNGPAECDG